MWAAFKRIIAPRGAIVLTASQPFTSALVMSNPAWFKYSWVWVKSKASNHTNAKIRPMTRHEDVLVFSKGTTANGSSGLMTYHPQGVRRVDREVYRPSSKFGGVHHSWDKEQNRYTQEFENYPDTVLEFSNPNQGSLHPTQKPSDLFEYLIRTYTQPGELVFDPCVGSGTTAVAARLSGRAFIVGDQSADYCEIARQRVASVYGVRELMTQTDMFAQEAQS